jgi:glutaredoxin 3
MEKLKKQPKVILFSTPTCTYCTQAKRYLKQNSIRFRDVDISKDTAAMRDMQRRTGGNTGVPVILINNKPVIGFNKPEINRLLDIN